MASDKVLRLISSSQGDTIFENERQDLSESLLDCREQQSGQTAT